MIRLIHSFEKGSLDLTFQLHFLNLARIAVGIWNPDMSGFGMVNFCPVFEWSGFRMVWSNSNWLYFELSLLTINIWKAGRLYAWAVVTEVKYVAFIKLCYQSGDIVSKNDKRYHICSIFSYNVVLLKVWKNETLSIYVIS